MTVPGPARATTAGPSAPGASTGPAVPDASGGRAGPGTSSGPVARDASPGPATSGTSPGPAVRDTSPGPATSGTSAGPGALAAPGAPGTGAPLRIANCSGFYGDRLSAAREMVEGGPIDVLTGDWLAELTMLILAGQRRKGRPGYARTFLTQLEEVLGTCLDRGIRIVSNAGGLDPAGCAAAVTELAGRLGLAARVAHVTGDDLAGRDLGGLVDPETGGPP
ncbi:acyclic terpene utilization AtuA family protein, partial [Sphaerisporangium rufum]|uniref:acyclic terpene utilization AtuA family protein n=1 Tax=Sphaerisporangium rufum TaxID=1381558 RepID=UPI001EF1F0CC